jgi:hypothetical protein
VVAVKTEFREVIDKTIELRKLYQNRTILFLKDVLETLISDANYSPKTSF